MPPVVASDGYSGPRTFTGTLRLEKERMFITPDAGYAAAKLSRALFEADLVGEVQKGALDVADLGLLHFTTSAWAEVKLSGQDPEKVKQAVDRLSGVGRGWRLVIGQTSN